MQSLDDLGNPLPYELGGFECPEEMKELIEQVKLINKVMEYCSKNPKECE